METPTVTGTDWAALDRGIDGTVVLPDDSAYAAARTVALTQFAAVAPAAVVRCRTPEDVAEAVRFARKTGTAVRARSGGHSFAGYSTTSGMVIDVSGLNAVTLDGDIARVQAGTQLVDLEVATHAGGLTVPSGWCPTVAVAGLALGGGLGLTTREHGTTSDRMVSADLVLADGRLVRCDADHDADLFWACRGGGGGNFGVATEFRFTAVPATPLTTYALTWPGDRVVDVIDAWQHWAPGTPDALCALINVSIPDASGDAAAAVTVTGTWSADPDDLDPLLSALVARVGSDPHGRHLATQSHHDALMTWFGCDEAPPEPRLPVGDFATAHGGFVARSIPRAGLEELLATFAGGRGDAREAGIYRSLDLQAMGGAVNRVARDATAFVHRDTAYYIGVSANTDTAHAESVPAGWRWADETWRVLHRWTPSSYQNYIDPTLAGWREAYYGANYPRLRQVRARYDPDHFFRFPQAID